MLKQIDKNLSYEYQFYLCRRDSRQRIATLMDGYNSCEFVYQAEFRNVDQLSFSIPYYVRNKDMQLVKNPVWDKIKADMVVLMEVFMGDEKLFDEHFIINAPKKIGADTKKKSVTCYGYEQSLNNIKLRGFQGTRQLYRSKDDDIEIGEGILNLLEEKSHGDWKVGHIDDLVREETIKGIDARKYRTFQVDDKSWLSFIRDELEPSFEAVFTFSYDYEQNCNIINIYHVDNYSSDQGLYISENNYIDRLEQGLNIDELITRLTVRGKDGLNINSVNMGRAYLEDFSYYRNLDYMSQELLNAFNTYDALVESKKPTFQGYLDQLNTLTATLNTKVNEDMAGLVSQMTILQDNKDIAITNGLDQTDINTQITAKQAEITAKQAEIDDINSQITTVTNNITALGDETALENNFTEDQLKVINRYLREATWSCENYYDKDSLLEAGKKAQLKMNEPQLDLKLDIASFIDIVDCQYQWKRFGIGDVCHCEYTLWDDYFIVRIVGYEHQISNKQLSLNLSNRDFKYDAERYLSELSKDVSNTSTVVNSNKAMWDMSNTNGYWIADFIANGLDTTKYKVTAGKNQTISLDDRGATFGSFDDPGIIRVINNCIALSEDGVDYDLSLTPQGIIARKLIGTLIAGEKLLINNESGTVQINGDALLVKDLQGNVKVKLGKLDTERYGFCIYGKSGQVVISEDGILQTMPYIREDNVGIGLNESLLFTIIIPPETTSVRSAKLYFKLLPFRSYEKSIVLTSSGSHRHKLFSYLGEELTDMVNVPFYKYVFSNNSGGNYPIATWLPLSPASGNGDISGSYSPPELFSHSSDGAHSHPTSIERGIFTDSTANNIDVYIDGVFRLGTYTSNQSGLELKDYLQSPGEHSIQLTSSQIGRIHATVLVTAFLTT